VDLSGESEGHLVEGAEKRLLEEQGNEVLASGKLRASPGIQSSWGKAILESGGSGNC